MTDVVFNITDSADDGRCIRATGAGYGDYIFYETFGKVGSDGYQSFFRFDNVTIPAGSVITSAVLRVTGYGATSAATCNVNIHFEDADDPAAPTDGADVISRSLTAAVAWSSIAAWADSTAYDSPDLKTILQAVIDRPGWNSGQAVIVNVIDNGSSSGAERRSRDYRIDPGESADLVVSYTEAQLATIDEGAGVDDEIDAFNLSDELQEGAGASDEIDAFNSSGWLDEGAGTGDDIDATKEADTVISEGAGTSDSVNASAEYIGTISEGAGAGDEIDALNWAQWLRANKDKSIERYFFTLTGSADSTTDLEIPITTFQARKRTGESTYLTVTVKGYATYAAAITARSNGEMIIEMGYEIAGEIVLREEILRADLEDIRLDLGPLNRSITLTGHKTQTFASQAVELENPIYKNVTNGRISYRFAQFDPYLNPGDACTVGDDTFTVDHIIYMASPLYKTMEVKET